ncbi:hypothetical protein D7294_09890 [Streptomyces hoynatensis]|uniref:Uncharacterized protein n=1 Tax=Streptomyces hoynatensis TaxID=1141874 RepID=A0A3A9Z788_9ACTN|nr:hypothetical protein D7294_09890 [Streptomyces hoynatensis]
MARLARAHLGRRGGFLLLVGLGEVVWGFQFRFDPAPNPRGLTLLTEVAPLRAWAWLWVVSGLLAALAACVRSRGDWLGFAAALTPPMMWLAAYLTAACSGEYPRGLWLAAYYSATHVGVCLWASATPEHAPPPRPGPTASAAREGTAG